VPTDERGRVEDVDGVYAAGDITSHPVKQGGQQADTIAADIAARATGVAQAADWPIVRILRARLIGGAQPIELSRRSTATAARSTPASPPPVVAAPPSTPPPTPRSTAAT
jgi:hypothetical protein